MIAAKKTPGSEKLLDDIIRDHKSKFINTGFIF
jgi:aldehyde dehydrogenase (NAD+)